MIRKLLMLNLAEEISLNVQTLSDVPFGCQKRGRYVDA